MKTTFALATSAPFRLFGMLFLLAGLMLLPETVQAQRKANRSIRPSSANQQQERTGLPERREDRQDDRDDRQEDRLLHRHHYHRHGHIVVDLPRGYATVRVGGARYFYYEGVYYRSGSSGYIVVAAPVGAVIVTLPVGYTTVYVGETTYYYYYGSYYVWHPGRGYVVVAAPIGATVSYLPDDYTTVYIDGVRYYRFGGVSYRSYYRNGTTVFVSVRL